MIIRIAKRNQYAIIATSVFNDTRLSWRSLGILCYLLSKPDDWSVNYRHLAAHRTEGETAVRTAMKELREAGYLVQRRVKGEDGKIVWECDVFESPQHPPCGDYPRMDDPGMDNHVLLSTDVLSNDDEIEDPFMEPAPLSPSSEYINPIEERERILKEPPHSKHTKDSATCNATYLQEGIRMYKAYRIAWEEKYGSPSAVNPAGPGLLQALIEEHTPERIALALQRFFDNGDAYTKRARHPITLFAKQATNYLVDIPEESPRPPLTEAQKKVMQMGLDALKRRK